MNLSGTLPPSVFVLCSKSGVGCSFGGGNNNITLNLSVLTALPTTTQSVSISGTPWGVASVTGPLPSLAAFTALTSLAIDSQGGSLTGTIPDMFSGMVNLIGLDLHGNALSGTLPPSSYVLCSESGIGCNFGGNSLSGSAAAYVATLPSNTTSVSVSGFWGASVATGPVPNLAPFAQSLTSVQFSAAGLLGPIPTSLASLTNLRYLAMDNNALNGTIPDCWSGLSSLTVLYLYSNSLVGTLPPSLGSLFAQIYVQGNNGLNGTVPAAVLTNCAEAAQFTGGNCYLKDGQNQLTLPSTPIFGSGSAFDPTSLLATIAAMNATIAALKVNLTAALAACSV